MVVAATALNGVLAGASLDQSIKQLPARRRIGMVAFSTYSRAADLGPGILWYASIGIGSAVLALAAALIAFAQQAPLSVAFPLSLAAALSLVHSVATTQAAPTNFRQREVANDEAQLAAIFARFERWQTVRVVFQMATFGVLLWAFAVAFTRESAFLR